MGISIYALLLDVRAIICVCFGFTGCIFVLPIILCTRFLKMNTGDLSQYEIPIVASDLEAVVLALNAEKIDDDHYVSFRKKDGIMVRILAQYGSAFTKRESTAKRKRANKVINARYGISSKASLYDALSSLRINLVICNRRNDELLSWLNANTTMMLRRNEAIVSAAIIMGEQRLLFPACMEDLSIINLKRYEMAAVVLMECLEVSSEI